MNDHSAMEADPTNAVVDLASFRGSNSQILRIDVHNQKEYQLGGQHLMPIQFIHLCNVGTFLFIVLFSAIPQRSHDYS